MTNLEEGSHTLTLKVWDVYNNSSKSTIEFIVAKNENLALLKKDGVDEYLLNQKDLTTEQLLKLKENNIKNRDQLADLSSYELLEIITDIESKKAEEIIIESRKHWFEDKDGRK